MKSDEIMALISSYVDHENSFGIGWIVENRLHISHLKPFLSHVFETHVVSKSLGSVFHPRLIKPVEVMQFSTISMHEWGVVLVDWILVQAILQEVWKSRHDLRNARHVDDHTLGSWVAEEGYYWRWGVSIHVYFFDDSTSGKVLERAAYNLLSGSEVTQQKDYLLINLVSTLHC